MRYRFFSIVCAAIFVAGCTKLPKGKTREDVLTAAAAPFTFTGTATLEGISQPVRLKVTKAANGLTAELLEPDTVKGLMVEFGQDRIKTTFRGLVMNLSSGDIPQQSIFIALRDVFSNLPGEDAVISEDGGLITVSSKAGMLPYELLWSSDKLVLKAVKLPSMGGIIQIDDFIKTT